jgi:hypothetical protein
MAKSKVPPLPPSAFQKSIQPVLIGVILLVIAFIAYKAYVAVQTAAK